MKETIKEEASQGIPESLLTSCVPNGELYALILQSDEFQPEVYTCMSPCFTH